MEPVNVSLYEKKIFADVIKDLKMRSSQIIWMSLNPMKSGLIKWAKDTPKFVKMEAETGVMHLQAKEFRELLATTWNKEMRGLEQILPRASKKDWTLLTPQF